MFIVELFNQLDLSTQESIQKSLQGNKDYRRLQQTKEKFKLSDIVLVYLVRGSLKSATIEDLDFSTKVTKYNEKGF